MYRWSVKIFQNLFTYIEVRFTYWNNDSNIEPYSPISFLVLSIWFYLLFFFYLLYTEIHRNFKSTMNVSKISSKYVPISINPFYHLRGYLLKDIQVFSDIAFLPNLMLLNLLFWKFSTKCMVLKLTQLLRDKTIIIGMHSLGVGDSVLHWNTYTYAHIKKNKPKNQQKKKKTGKTKW